MSDKGIQGVFIEEAGEILANLEPNIISLENNFDEAVFEQICRDIHTLKGSSGVAGFRDIHEFTQLIESLLEIIKSDKSKINKGIISLLINCVDWIKLYIHGNDKQEHINDLNKIKEFLVGIIKYIEKNGTTIFDSDVINNTDLKNLNKPPKYFKIKAYFKENILTEGIDPLMIIEDLISMGTVIEKKIDRKKLPDLLELNPENCYFGWEIIIETNHTYQAIKDIFLFVIDDNDIKIEDVTYKYISKHIDFRYQECKRLGEILLDKGIITDNQLAEVVTVQREHNVKMGELLLEKGYASDSDVETALKEQDEVRKKIDNETVRVDAVKLDNLMNLLGEIVIGQASLIGISEELGDEVGSRLKNALYSLDRVTREFQEQLMSIRMVPINQTFEQLKSYTKDVSLNFSKEIRVEIEGVNTEFDKGVIEKIREPLKFMISYAVEHSLEYPQDRIKAGKEEMGSIILKAYYQESNVTIEVVDNGKGIDIDNVREKAEKMGYIKPKETVSREKLLSFIFLPGFSNLNIDGNIKEKDLSVIKTSIESLKGTVSVESKDGEGLKFKIKLPLALAIIEGMLIRVGKQVYITPLLSIVESIQPKNNEVKTIEGKGEVVLVRGEYVSLVRLYKLFNIEPDISNPWEALVMIVEAGGEKVALMIDELIGQQQIVVKNLENNLTSSQAVSGAAVLGDGRVALIIDIAGLIAEISK